MEGSAALEKIQFSDSINTYASCFPSLSLVFIQIRSELEGLEFYNNNINKRALRLRTAAGADVCVHKAAYTLEKSFGAFDGYQCLKFFKNFGFPRPAFLKFPLINEMQIDNVLTQDRV